MKSSDQMRPAPERLAKSLVTFHFHELVHNFQTQNEKTETPASLFWSDVATFIPRSSSKDMRGDLTVGPEITSQIL